MLTKDLWAELAPETCDNPDTVRIMFPRVFTADQEQRITKFVHNVNPKIKVVCEHSGNSSKLTYMLTICIGSLATDAVLGRKIDPYSNRRGYAWDYGHPVVWISDTQKARDNCFVSQAFKADLTWALEEFYPKRDHLAKYHVIETEEDSWSAIHAFCDSSHWVAYDFETAGAMYSDYFECIMMAATTDTGDTYVWGREAIRNSRIWNPVLEWLEAENNKKVGHNIKYDMMAPNAHWGIQVRGVHSDTQLKRKLLLADANSGLELCSDLVGLGGYKQHFGQSLKEAKQLINNARSKRTRELRDEKELTINDDKALEFIVSRRDLKPDAVAYGLVPNEDLEIYCARDAYTTMKLEHHLDAQLREDDGLAMVWDELVCPAVEALSAMEAHGVRVDSEALEDFSKYAHEKQEEMRMKLEDRGLYSPNAAHAVAKFLFTDLGLKSWKKTPGGQPSTDAKVLKSLRNEHEAVGEILEYKRLGKLVQAYAESLPRHVTQDSRIHPSFRIDGTRTGRMSCANPGLHQIPRSASEEGRMLKRSFTAQKGHYLVQLDYSQLEYRVAAMLSQDRVMTQLFIDGKDCHQGTAEMISQVAWGIPPEQVTKEHRNFAKQVNFGLLYGMQDKGLAERLQCSEMEAAKIRSAVLGGFTGLATWITQREHEVKETGEVRTWWKDRSARIRPLWDAGSAIRWHRMKARNAAVNTPVQGTASDFCLASIGRIYNAIQCEQFPGNMVLTVHDSIVLEVPKAQLGLAARASKIIMESWPSMGVPLKVDVEYGERWGELKGLEL